MESIKLKSRIGEDGILRVQVPTGLRNQEFEIMIILQPIGLPQTSLSHPSLEPSKSDTPESRGWHPGFFETVVGSWEGEPLERPSQLPYEVREELTFGEEMP
jgi:hypothetical protein